MRQTVILVGGHGARPGAPPGDAPTPLLPVAGSTSFLELLIGEIARHGVEEVLLLAGHMAEQVEQHFAGVTIRSAAVKIIREPAPAGTGGALLNAQAHLDDVFLMTYGDSLLDINFLALAAALGPNDIGALAVRRALNGRRFGRVEAVDGRITAFREKDPSYAGEALISGGVYVLRKSVVNEIKATPCSIESDVFPVIAARGQLAALEVDGFFIDIGLPEALSQARAELPAALRRGAVFFDRDGTLNEDEGYTHKPDDLVWRPGAIEAIRACNDAGRFVFVVTNQSGIARGYFDEAAMRGFHARMQRELIASGAHIDHFYFSPFHADGSVAHLALDNHPDRKPNAGMLRRACAEWPVDLSRSFMVGDRDDDVGAAKAMGIPGVKVDAGGILPAVAKLLGEKMSKPSADPVAALKDRAAKTRAWLFEHALPLWWDKGFDRASGGFFERLNADGSPAPLPRRVRVQARQTYVFVLAGDLGWSGPWREACEAGAKVLLEHCLRAGGGVRHMLDQNGKPFDDRRDLYDTAFVVFALSHAGRALKRRDLIAKAEELVGWLEANWAHPAGGFREGDVTPCPPRRQNPHMHMFEAFLALHGVTRKPEHLFRASSIAYLFATRLFDSNAGALPEYFDDNWVPAPGEEGRICEPGHHFEWSWLLTRWRAAGGGDLQHEAERLRVHGETYGVDPAGFAIDETYLDGSPRATTSRLWPHTERIKANLARYEMTRDANAATAVVQAVDALMAYFETPTKGLWRDRRMADGSFVDEPAPASSFYHIALALAELDRVAKL